MIKPSVFFVLILCIAGYSFAKNYHKTHYNLKRSSGYHTFLMSAVLGAILFSIATIVYIAGLQIGNATGLDVSFGRYILIDVFKGGQSASEVIVFDIALISMLLAWVIPALYYFIKGNKKALFFNQFAEDPKSPEFTRLFFMSHYHEMPILFTMSDRKVYIGFVTEIYSNDFNDIHIIPYVSGYRDKDTLELKTVTPYQDVMDEIKNNNQKDVDLKTFTVALPLREIAHAHLYDFNHEENFHEKEQKHRDKLEFDKGNHWL
ncbi:hypothetical protein [Aliivibrio logei]|uniref:Uncharacterized protein n=1 Tax=Aliivibrio logei TaxID=688 RepID=A0A1B9NTH7_ALILO|nr:hypothetical protein [Aliivibrio logei]OCH17021.1 hypothetical protein A6E04_19395 [Aliivibrio logei]